MKWQPDRIHWPIFIRNNLVILLAASLAFYVLWFVTLSYSLKGGLASWHFPVAMVFVAILHLRLRYCMALFVGAHIGHYTYLSLPEITSAQDLLWGLIVAVASQLVPILGVVFIKLKSIPIRLDLLHSAIAILAAALFYISVRFIQYYMLDSQTLYGDAQLFELFMGHIVTGLVGIFIGLILTFTIRDVSGYWMGFTPGDKYLLAAQLCAVLISIILLYQYQPNSLYLLKTILFIPLLYLTYRFAWPGAMLFASSLILMSLVLLFPSADESLIIEFQSHIISYSLVAILVGALVNEHKMMQARLHKQNRELEVKNSALDISNIKIQGMAERVTQVRENERKVLSQTLHDELGQSVTAMKLGIYIVEKKSHDVDLESLAIVKKSAEAIYDNVYDLLQWLRPSISDDIGLLQTITGSYFSDKMQSLNILYHSQVMGDVERLSDSHKNTIITTLKQAVTHTLKQANAQHFYVDLRLNADNVILSIGDDGQSMGLHGSPSVDEYGLLGIEDKVLSLGGHVHFDREGKFRLVITLPLDKSAH
jgi:glucose-6-phosphate-specific signal transduction histidine kinase